MKIPYLGTCDLDENNDICHSDLVHINSFNIDCEFIIEGYQRDDQKNDFHNAIYNFINLTDNDLKNIEPHIYQYYKDYLSHYHGHEKIVQIQHSEDILDYITIGFEIYISRRFHGDNKIYISIECNCEWEPEHGLQLVFRDGNQICKVSPFDGHLTNSDAYADSSLEDVIYVPFRSI
ncbi:DUF6985 domain-containing protein [uncultured Tolumonas sp.]|uniref:DUF6985 domain-containing protein n=1 Tax=uncultured Tolumonas sp. TaxID=263765 RepID=UPI00292E872F|nr:hypothetical protein [uncultured Tolumonas sp.]